MGEKLTAGLRGGKLVVYVAGGEYEVELPEEFSRESKPSAATKPPTTLLRKAKPGAYAAALAVAVAERCAEHRVGLIRRGAAREAMEAAVGEKGLTPAEVGACCRFAADFDRDGGRGLGAHSWSSPDEREKVKGKYLRAALKNFRDGARAGFNWSNRQMPTVTTVSGPVFDAAQNHAEQAKKRLELERSRIANYASIRETAKAHARQVMELRKAHADAMEAAAKIENQLRDAMAAAHESCDELERTIGLCEGRGMAVHHDVHRACKLAVHGDVKDVDATSLAASE